MNLFDCVRIIIFFNSIKCQERQTSESQRDSITQSTCPITKVGAAIISKKVSNNASYPFLRMIFFNGNILNTTELYFKMVKMVKIK